jgi:hypothetical protein
MAAAITIEFYGMARRQAGRSELHVVATTVAEALASAGIDGTSPHYLVSVNAGPFLSDLHAGLKAGDHVVVMSTDAGG